MDLSLDGYSDVSGHGRRLAESHHIGLAMDPGPVRDGVLEAVRMGGFSALEAAIRHAQQALAAARAHRFDEALHQFEMAGVEAHEALTIPWAGDRPAIDRPGQNPSPRPGPAAARQALGALRGRRPPPDEGST